ncbi:PhosphoLipid PhosPhatase-like protein [Aphelenchoides fujianensis]|nr:PhosphoLipid PhosPhatase-like protein [Aphelenchoides fujianensis]
MIFESKKPAVFVPSDVVIVTTRPAGRFSALLRYTLGMSAIVALFLYLHHAPQLVQVHGFDCADDSIRHPFVRSYLTMKDVFILALIPPFFIILATEAIRLFRNNDPDLVAPCEDGLSKGAKLITRVVLFYSYLFAAITFDILALFFAKFSVGRLRPHFIEVCRPSVGFERCNESRWIADYTCTNTNQKRITNARMSFFSGHSNLSATAATFLIFYLQSRLQGQIKCRWFVPLAQALLVACTLWTGYSRVADFKHHTTDVLFGFAVGILISSLVCTYGAGLGVTGSWPTWRKRSLDKLPNQPSAMA